MKGAVTVLGYSCAVAVFLCGSAILYYPLSIQYTCSRQAARLSAVVSLWLSAERSVHVARWRCWRCSASISLRALAEYCGYARTQELV